MTSLPLDGLRVVDTTDGAGAMCSRFLADLGADVILVEPPGGSESRRHPPCVAGAGLSFALHNANKRRVELDLTSGDGRRHFLQLIDRADIWIDGHRPGTLEQLDLAPDVVQVRCPRLVICTITDFGFSGPYRDWTATDWVLLALGGQLSRSGVPGRPPFMPPGSLADETTCVQAAWAVLLAYWSRLETGWGDVVEVSRRAATAQVIDPAFGSVGSAAAQRGAVPLGREKSQLYPIFPCADGHVRVVVLAPRQWRGMRAWLGEPAEFADPKFDSARERFAVTNRLYPLIADLFRDDTMAELVAQGQRRGVPVAPLLSLAEAADAEHFRVRGLFTDLPVTDGVVGRAPTGHVLVNGVRAGIRTPLRVVTGEVAALWADRPADEPSAGRLARRPLEGVRVLDLGVIVMGGEAGRLFADQGADVIKIENRRFPDGARMGGMTPFFAAGQRNKRSMGVDLRSTEGRALFEQLVVQSDVVLSNFKPGTMESLELSPGRLRELNPAIVVVTSSAMGESGPWRDWMGYGPLVRCVSGLTRLWADPGVPVDDAFGDATTIYPDHFVARVVDAAVLACLIRRRLTGRGAHIESSQAESIVVSLGTEFLRESLEPGSVRPRVNDEHHAPWGVYPCEGYDAWCVITVQSDVEWSALVEAIGAPVWAADPLFTETAGRLAGRAVIDRELSAWTSRRTATVVASTLQEVGVPAAAMAHIADLPSDPDLVASHFFREMAQPGLDAPVLVEAGPCRAGLMQDPPLRGAPRYGEHTREVCKQLLGLTDEAIDDLVERGILDEARAPTP
jgi:crotonobetainyl-CoA:carnitine CoA-transferase CaiB-like acyl-CoA transferase